MIKPKRVLINNMDIKKGMLTMHKIKIVFIFILFLAFSACGQKSINAPDINNNTSRVTNEYSRVVTLAQSQVGKPYKSGGHSPSVGFDCSGLIYWAYLQTGIKLPRTTVGQAKVGKSVPIVAMKPGDILVFRSNSAPNGLHTAIYAGNNTMIHSPNARSKVRNEPISQSWIKNFKDVRRVN